jgi:hypothetical protein
MGATMGVNFAVGGPIGIITALGVFPGIRKQDWYHSLAGWGSWFMPASWPGHIMGLGVFLGNGIAHVFGSDRQIESMKFDFKHGQIMTARRRIRRHAVPVGPQVRSGAQSRRLRLLHQRHVGGREQVVESGR